MMKDKPIYNEKKRLSLQMNKELKEWCEIKADEMGVSLNGFINVVLSNLKRDDDL